MRNTRKEATAAERLVEALGATMDSESSTVTVSHPDWSRDLIITERSRNVRYGRVIAFLFRWAVHTLGWTPQQVYEACGFIGSPAHALSGHETNNLEAIVPSEYKRDS